VASLDSRLIAVIGHFSFMDCWSQRRIK